MPCQTLFPTIETAGAAAHLLAAVRSGSISRIEEELHSAARVCAQPFNGDTAEDERRELLDSVVGGLRQALAAGEAICGESRALAGCILLLKHLQVENPRHYFAAAAACRHRAISTVQ